MDDPQGEMYQYGTQYWLIGPSYIIVCFVAAHVILPVLYKLEITSAYHYLELRFNKVVRAQGFISFLIQMCMYMGIVLYAPSLAINAVTGLSWKFSVLILGCVCTFYTTIGGMKAVMWTDVFQITIMFSGMIAIIVIGTIEVGSWSEVWAALERGQRLEFFKAIWINLPGLWLLLTICAMAGLVAYAYYEHCDPLTTGRISKGDQILPLFVMDVLNFPGFPGLFVATIFSGALSTVSSGLNALAAVTLEDIVKPYCLSCTRFKFKEFTEEHGAVAAKIIAFSYGVLALILAFVASLMGDTLQAALGLFGMVGGPILGLFLLGMLFPFANWQGACAGHIFGEIMSLWVGFGSYIWKYPVWKPPLLVDECPNGTTQAPAPFDPDSFVYQGLHIYRLSYMWQGTFAILCTIIMGIIVSLITRIWSKKEVDPDLIAPVCDWFCCCLPEGLLKILRCGTNYKETYDVPVTVEKSPAKTYPSIDTGPEAKFIYKPEAYGNRYNAYPETKQAYGNPGFRDNLYLQTKDENFDRPQRRRYANKETTEL